MPRPDATERLKAAAPKQGPSKVLIASVITIILVVAGFAAFLVTQNGTSGNAAVPKGATADGNGILLYPSVKPSSGAKTLNVYEDFQCPICEQFETNNGKQMNAMAKAGEVKVTVHIMSFLDDKLGNDSSKRAANAAFCAADADRFAEYHSTVYANQPTTEGTGYTDAQLKSFGKTAGISGSALDTFNKCVTDQKYKDYVNLTETKSGKNGVNGTPTFFINDKELSNTGDGYTKLLTQPDSLQSVLSAN